MTAIDWAVDFAWRRPFVSFLVVAFALTTMLVVQT